MATQVAVLMMHTLSGAAIPAVQRVHALPGPRGLWGRGRTEIAHRRPTHQYRDRAPIHLARSLG